MSFRSFGTFSVAWFFLSCLSTHADDRQHFAASSNGRKAVESILSKPDLKTEIKFCKTQWQEELTEKEALEMLRERGCKIRSKENVLEIDILKYRGTMEDFKSIVSVKTPIHVKVNIRDQYELLEILCDAKLAAIDFKCREALRIPDKDLRAEITKAIKKICEKCKSIEKLDFSFADIDPEAMSSLGKLVNLKTVILPANATDKTLSGLGSLPKLKGIGFMNSRKITGSGFKDFKENKLIMALGFNNTRMDTENFKYLKKFPNLKIIVMPQNCDNEDVSAVSKLNGIEQLHFSNTCINDRAIKYLADMENLKLLSIIDSPVTDRAASEINKLKNLQEFRCGETFMTRAGFDKIKVGNRSRSRNFFKPDNDEQIKMIKELLDNKIPIKASRADMSEMTLFLKKGRKYDLSKMGKIKFRRIYVFNVPSSESLEAILKLNDDAIVVVNNQKIPDSTIEKLKGHFKNFHNPGEKRK